MNELQAQITADMKAALKAGEKDRLQVLRLVIAALKDAQLHQESDDMSIEQEQDVLRRMVKARRDSVEQAEKAGRQDIADSEAAEIVVLQSYLPAMMDPAEIAEKVAALAAEIGFGGPKDTGRFMKEWMSRYKGLAEGRDVQAALRSLSS
jgi:uncharacterized protein YqeY